MGPRRGATADDGTTRGEESLKILFVRPQNASPQHHTEFY